MIFVQASLTPSAISICNRKGADLAIHPFLSKSSFSLALLAL